MTAEILGFYRNYHSRRVVGHHLVPSAHRGPVGRAHPAAAKIAGCGLMAPARWGGSRGFS